MPWWLQKYIHWIQNRIPRKWRIPFGIAVPLIVVVIVFLVIWVSTLHGNCGYVSRDGSGGYRSDRVQYWINGDLLTVEGSGIVSHYTGSNRPPWSIHALEIRRLLLDTPQTGWGCFQKLPRLREVRCTEVVRDFGEHTFSGCSNLESIVCPGIEFIMRDTFRDCVSLTTVSKMENLRILESGCFYGCISLESFYIGPYLKTIEATTFMDCSSLSTVTGCQRITEIQRGAFSGCTSLVQIDLPEFGPNNPPPHGRFQIGERAFRNCSSLTEMTVPWGTKVLARSVFEGCSGMRTIILPDTITQMETSCLEGCGTLCDITLPDGLERIGRRAFADCTAIEELVIPATVTDISSDAFAGWTAEQTIRIRCDSSAIDGPLDTEATIIWEV